MVKRGEIYRVFDNGREFFVQVVKPPVWEGDPNTGKEEFVYACTRSLYCNSVFGMIEQAGWVRKDRLIPLKNTKKDRAIRKQLNRARRKGMERSQAWYEIEKARA